MLTLAYKYRQACVLVTHDVDEAIYLADRVVVLSRLPTRVVREIAVELEKPRDQLATKEDPHYLELRHEVITLIRSMSAETKRDPSVGAVRS
ncbi:hypothetical protein [Paraburkholderia strydomiana]|uniref:hypothetical protein n=1 Tax=Paraburkholderia strydomiana TaxID=1245417 RepID=UPI001BE92BCC|nr:hypothetical protein [Paraburkholderia strydomiana]MBT2792085.1 hypothetical protein [Paraburkholderia strydomiana]